MPLAPSAGTTNPDPLHRSTPPDTSPPVAGTLARTTSPAAGACPQDTGADIDGRYQEGSRFGIGWPHHERTTGTAVSDAVAGDGLAAIPGHEHPDVLAVCRWLPLPIPFGAFSGSHDHVHVGDRQGYVNLWWSQTAVHVGDYVGPARGGLVADPKADYDVAMPVGGYLHVRDGVLVDWSDEPAGSPVLRADGERFVPQTYGPGNPYWLHQYRLMDDDDRLNALAGVPRRQQRRSGAAIDRVALARAIADWVQHAGMPDTCPSCCGPQSLLPVRGPQATAALVRRAGVVATLTGANDAQDALAVLWDLTDAIADPRQAGLARGAGVAADDVLTDEGVAQAAAQVLRWHGMAVAGQLPFWTLGWIFVPPSVFDALMPGAGHLVRERAKRALLEHADRLRVDRVTRAWTAANQAHRMRASLGDLVEAVEGGGQLSAAPALELVTDTTRFADGPGEADALFRRTVESVIAELLAHP